MPITGNFRVLLVALVGFGASVVPGAGETQTTNIAPNHGVEKAQADGLPEGWGRYMNISAETGITDKEFYTGRRCAYLKLPKPGAEAALSVGKITDNRCDEAIPVRPGTKYYYSFFIKSDGFIGKIAVSPLEFKSDGSAVDRETVGIEITPQAGWVRHLGSFTTGDQTQQAVLVFLAIGPKRPGSGTDGTIYIDEIYFGVSEADARKEVLDWRGEAMAKDLWLTAEEFAAQISHISDADLFAAIDLDRPGLKKVKQAVKAKDYKSAYRAWGDYWKENHQEKPPAPQQSADKKTIEKAQAIIRHEITDINSGGGNGQTRARGGF